MYMRPPPNSRNLSLPVPTSDSKDIYLECKLEQCRVLSRAKARIDRIGPQTLSDEQDTESRRHIPSSLVAPLAKRDYALFLFYFFNKKRMAFSVFLNKVAEIRGET